MQLNYQNSADSSTVSSADSVHLAAPLLYTQNHSTPPLSETPLFRRVERFSLQSVARSILPDQRVSKCLRVPIGQSVNVKHNKVTDSFGYRNLETCASVWHCPVCASKISEKRRVDLASGISRWKDQGGSVLFLTLTVQHYICDTFKRSREGLAEAYGKLLNRPSGKKLLASMGVVGRIRALEVTYGSNGWHPHFHVLLFLKTPLPDALILMYQTALLDLWRNASTKVGLKLPNDHGLTLQDGSYAAAYASKWGLESEMTKGHTKKSRVGYSPFDLLRHALGTYQGDAPLLSPGKAKSLFRDYAMEMKGRRQLVWSDGLRDLLGLGKEKTDQELVDEVEEQETLFVRIPLDMWKAILKAERRAEVLEACRAGLDAFYQYCKPIWLQYGGNKT